MLPYKNDHIRMSKYKIIFAKGYIPHVSDEVFAIKKVKNMKASVGKWLSVRL